MAESHVTPEHPAGAPDWDAIARYLAGESSADEARAMETVARTAAEMQRRAGEGIDVEAALARVHERMRAPADRDTPVIPLRAPTRSGRRQIVPWVVAAAAIVVMVVGFMRGRRDTVPAAERVFATAVGRIDSIRLADGTRVTLGPSSALIVDAGFATGRREVSLRGTAVFEVTHDAARPFAVRAGRLLITDVGTKFSVREDGTEGVEVSVREGAVRVSHASGGAIVLASGDIAALQGTGALVVQRAAATDEDAGWARGRLVFREAPLARVRSDLRRWFGVELVVADSALAGRHLTASFARDSREQVLDVIALALGATYEVRGDTVMLRPSLLTVRPRK